jgi:hypothetical protein
MIMEPMGEGASTLFREAGSDAGATSCTVSDNARALRNMDRTVVKQRIPEIGGIRHRSTAP